MPLWACGTTQPASLHLEWEQGGFCGVEGAGRGQAEVPQGGQVGPGRDFGLRDSKAGNLRGAGAIQPSLSSPSERPGPGGGGGGHRPPHAPHLRPRKGAPTERPPPRRSLRRQKELGPGWNQEGSSLRLGPLGQRLQPPATRGRALSLTAPDPQLQLGLVQVLHVVPQKAVQQVRDHRLQHHGGTQAQKREEPEPTGAAEGGDQRCERQPPGRRPAPAPRCAARDPNARRRATAVARSWSFGGASQARDALAAGRQGT